MLDEVSSKERKSSKKLRNHVPEGVKECRLLDGVCVVFYMATEDSCNDMTGKLKMKMKRKGKVGGKEIKYFRSQRQNF